MQPLWLCIHWGRQIEETFRNPRWRKDKQMQPVWFCILSGRQFEDAFENTQRRKVKQMQPVWLCILFSRKYIWGDCVERLWRIFKKLYLGPIFWGYFSNFGFSTKCLQHSFQNKLAKLRRHASQVLASGRKSLDQVFTKLDLSYFFVCLTLCEVSGTLTEWKSETVMDLRTDDGGTERLRF